MAAIVGGSLVCATLLLSALLYRRRLVSLFCRGPFTRKWQAVRTSASYEPMMTGGAVRRP